MSLGQHGRRTCWFRGRSHVFYDKLQRADRGGLRRVPGDAVREGICTASRLDVSTSVGQYSDPTGTGTYRSTFAWRQLCAENQLPARRDSGEIPAATSLCLHAQSISSCAFVVSMVSWPQPSIASRVLIACPPCRARSDLCRLASCRAVAFAGLPAGDALELRRAALHSEQLNVAVDFADPTPGDARLQEFQVPNVLLLMTTVDQPVGGRPHLVA
jgi:hypothetical protein